jgi:hypothetical protein
MDDAINYKGITSGIYHSIDNIVISNELFNNYIANSVQIETMAQNLVANFTQTTSDHFPVSAVFSFFNESAVENLIADNGIAMYPNPAKDELKVECGELKVNTVNIFDVAGKMVHNFQFSTFNSQLTIDVRHLQSGVYFLRIDDTVQKFVKE